MACPRTDAECQPPFYNTPVDYPACRAGQSFKRLYPEVVPEKQCVASNGDLITTTKDITPSPVPPVKINNITISIVVVGRGTVQSSGGDNQLASRSSISVPYGYQVYFQANAAQGWQFDHFEGMGQTSTSSSFSVPVIQGGTVTAVFTQTVGGGTCPRTAYYTPGWLENSCDTGYHKNRSDWFTACICDTATPSSIPADVLSGANVGSPTDTSGLSNLGLGDLTKMLPTLLIVMVIASIIGAFRK